MTECATAVASGHDTSISLSDRVEALLHMMCEELWDADDQVRLLACQSVIPEAGRVPLQYLVCILDLPQARQALLTALPAWQEALHGLQALLDHAEGVWAEDTSGWASFVSLLTAPLPVRRPSQPDLRDHDVLLALERDICFGGSWNALIEWLHQQGTRQNQAEIQRIRQLSAFEHAYRVNLRDVLGAT